ncbi:hypothetical protein I4U23_016317 [Adineta vaga]|nr:hypothetical protein I4U23_016317 [Adineta vaga]
MPYNAAIHPNHCVVKITNMQIISPEPTVAAGIKGTAGNMYISCIFADTFNHRIQRFQVVPRDHLH